MYLKENASIDATITLNSYTYYNSDTTLVRKMNPKWSKVRGNSEEAWNENEVVAAFLNTPDLGAWKCDKAKAKYKLGGISIEMYTMAYNDVQHPASSQYELGTYFDEENNGYGYTIDGEIIKVHYTKSNILDWAWYNRMFCPQDNGSIRHMIFSSPFWYTNRALCTVNLRGCNLDYNSRSGNIILSYLTCLRSDFEMKVRL